jgi:hypothetical protein
MMLKNILGSGKNGPSFGERLTKLKLYFQIHQVVVLTNQPLRQILHKLDMYGRLVRWAIELGEYGILYQSRPTIKE